MLTRQILAVWLQSTVKENPQKSYRHRVLKEDPNGRDQIIDKLTLYIQKAHEDARNQIRKPILNFLDPLGVLPSTDRAEGYPELLHLTTLKGYFGEIFAGIIAENFSPFDINDWKVPAYLFRFHLAAFQQLEYIRQTGIEATEIPGRTGDDCVAFQLNSEGEIIRGLYCEAKCNPASSRTVIKKAYAQVSKPAMVDLLRMIEVLQDNDAPDAKRWINALFQLDFAPSPQYERYDLVSYISRPPVRNDYWLPVDEPLIEYTGGRKLEAVEAHLTDIDELIQIVYARKKVEALAPITILEKNIPVTSPSNQIVDLARKLREDLAGATLPRSFAKLYSQYTQLSANQPGLSSWEGSDAATCLHDAVRLLEAGFVEKEAGNDSWTDSVRRTGELFEWLAHPQLNPTNLPLLLLSAASYQLAGYPARSLGLLGVDTSENNESRIVRFLLKADFPNLLNQLVLYWAENMASLLEGAPSLRWDNVDTIDDEIQQGIVRETASALGIICADMRWGRETRLEKAVQHVVDVEKALIHGYDSYSWLLAKLCSEVVNVYVNSSMRFHLESFFQGLSQEGQEAVERYLRQCYRDCKALAWPSQIRGIEKLTKGESFALCTPTGSGKTTIAEIAILQSLFLESNPESSTAPLALYLVPSRALATEVETKLTGVLATLNKPPIVITGLYGGTDWGPTDAWLRANEPTTLICTYEKAEALIRFLGSSFLGRVSLVVIDEAHKIQFSSENVDDLRNAKSRTLRLETLSSRLLTYLSQSQGKAIALSAMALNVEDILARWVTGQTDATATKTFYRSTRQLVGRLECLPGRRFRIQYDLIDNANLRLQFENDRQTEIPYIPNPFPSYPALSKWKDGPEQRLRPYLFWAAMQLASPDSVTGKQGAVLISVTQHINGYITDFLRLLKTQWVNNTPPFFQQPTEPTKLSIWKKCLDTCEDYFGSSSPEYQLMQSGIVVHHGRMPGLMARFLVEAIQEKIVYLVIATSTLSDGVNLPFETILVPSLLRRGGEMTAQEFGNLAGRVGRPGSGTEGHCLVLVEGEPAKSDNTKEAWQARKARERYDRLINDLSSNTNSNSNHAQSALAELIGDLEKQWQEVSGSKDRRAFLDWLEQTAPLQIKDDLAKEDGLYAVEALDMLDSILLSSIVEAEQATNEELSPLELEKQLHKVWQRTYAHYAATNEAFCEQIFVHRGNALKTTIYTSQNRRRRLYRTSIPPRSGNKLLQSYPQIIEHLQTGADYADQDKSKKDRFTFIIDTIDFFRSLPHFFIEETLGTGKNAPSWREILQWWLAPDLGGKAPSIPSQWHKFINDNFIYRFNWGLGSVISLAVDEVHNTQTPASPFEKWDEEWKQTNLPWIALWIKELIAWGTLEPVAAYLLSKGRAVTRSQAEWLSKDYYQEQSNNQDYNKLLDPTIIRDWTARLERRETPYRVEPPNSLKVKLLRDFSATPERRWRVLPVEANNIIYWLDPGGFPLARCQKPTVWVSSFLENFDFFLEPAEQTITSSAYL